MPWHIRGGGGYVRVQPKKGRSYVAAQCETGGGGGVLGTGKRDGVRN